MIVRFLKVTPRDTNERPGNIFVSHVYTPMSTRKNKKSKRGSKDKRGTKDKRNTRKHKLNKNEAIVQRLNPISETKIITEYKKLRELKCKGTMNVSSHLRLGNAVVDYFTMVERLHTKGNKGIDFYTFWEQREKYRKVPYVAKMLKFYKTRKIDEIRKFKYIFNMYFSSIAIFKPVVAMETYCRVKASRVLDFTMGWGGRLVGACALDLKSYIGIDLNTNLKPAYAKLESFLKTQGTHTQIDLRFQDALQIDYTKLDYDTVLTSPPYYDLETYRRSKPRSKDSWIEEFYKPLYERTWKGLKKGGHYCLNVPQEIYEETCVPVLGKSHMQFLLKKKDRTEETKYKEYIYVWKK